MLFFLLGLWLFGVKKGYLVWEKKQALSTCTNKHKHERPNNKARDLDCAITRPFIRRDKRIDDQGAVFVVSTGQGHGLGIGHNTPPPIYLGG